jgi:hypothetical protein
VGNGIALIVVSGALMDLGRRSYWRIKHDPVSAEAVLAKAHIRMSFLLSNAAIIRQPP